MSWSGQAPAVDEVLTGRQNLVLFGRLNRLRKAEAQRRADELLERFDLQEAARKSVKHYSGGMRRRLDLAVTLILSPAVLFLDEPTTGLDPRGRNEMWSAIRSLVAGGTTVLLTTQYLDEADQLADRHRRHRHRPDHRRGHAGRAPRRPLVEIGSMSSSTTTRTWRRSSSLLGRVARHRTRSRLGGPPRQRPGHRAGGGAHRVLGALSDQRIAAVDVGIRRPTLDDVFLRLTGHKAAA